MKGEAFFVMYFLFDFFLAFMVVCFVFEDKRLGKVKLGAPLSPFGFFKRIVCEVFSQFCGLKRKIEFSLLRFFWANKFYALRRASQRDTGRIADFRHKILKGVEKRKKEKHFVRPVVFRKGL